MFPRIAVILGLLITQSSAVRADGIAALVEVWRAEKYRFTPTVSEAYLKYARVRAMAELEAAKKPLPQDFLAWVDHDPLIAMTVYGARQDAAKVLLMLYSLEQDLGRKVVRTRYTQLALAAAVVHANLGMESDVRPHEPIKLTIPSSPLRPVNTKDPHRTLDVNDHIINFLTDHAPVAEQRPHGTKEAKSGDGMKPLREVYSEAKAKYSVVAADVLASKALQNQFNAYLKAHGQTVDIDCGDHVIFPDRHDAITDRAQHAAIKQAFRLFRGAYEAKGLLPAKRDPAPTPAQRCAFLIRNYETRLPSRPGRPWPLFRLEAPWPLMTLLVADAQPLREVDNLWQRYAKRGERREYGEFIGDIAQQFDMQSARRLCPYPFAYDTCQMMFKDGGVCGTMANIAVRTDNALGIPASTAGQPGHCALIHYGQDPQTKSWLCQGEQYVSAGDDDTHPHTPWFFGDVDAQKGMVYHQSIAWAVNYGMPAYLQSTLAYDLLRALPEDQRRAHGMELVESALAINPYNFLLVDAGQELANTPKAQFHLWETLHAALAKVHDRSGCPAKGLYDQTVRNKLFRHLAALPPPTGKKMLQRILAFLEHAQGNKTEALMHYRIADQGLAAVMDRVKNELKANVKGQRTPELCALISAEIAAVAGRIEDPAQRTQWLDGLAKITAGHEEYQNAGKPQHDPCADTIGRLLAGHAGKKKEAA